MKCHAVTKLSLIRNGSKQPTNSYFHLCTWCHIQFEVHVHDPNYDVSLNLQFEINNFFHSYFAF